MNNIVEEIIKTKFYRLGFWRVAFLFGVSAIAVLLFWLSIPSDYKSVISEIPDFLETLLLFPLFAMFFSLLVAIYECAMPLFEFYKRNKTIQGIPDIQKWIYQGSLKIQDSLEITSSNSGCLIKGNLYKDFTLSFGLKIINGGGVGIIFRAQDLENYLMLQIGLQDKNDEKEIRDGQIAITPHIRFLGNFETFNIQNHEPYYDTKQVFDSNGENVWLQVKDHEALLKIHEQEFRWNIPTNTEVNIVQHSPVIPSDTNTPEIWFRNRYGKIGFRAYRLEKVIVTNLKVVKL